MCEEDRKKELLKIQKEYTKKDFIKNEVICEIKDTTKTSQELTKKKTWYERLKIKVLNKINRFIGGGKND